jgi:hypothetical protein
MQDLFDWADKHGHNLICISSQRPSGRHKSLQWLGRHGLGFEEIHFVMGRYKWKKDVDWLVDDSPENWHNWKKGRGNDKGFILKDAVYNKHIPAENRIFKLTEIQEIVG